MWRTHSFRVMEDDAERDPLAGVDRRHSVAHARAVVAAGALDGALPGGEDDERSPLELDHMSPRLRARSLLEQDELAALEVLARTVQDCRHLQREGDLAVEVLVEGVVSALEVTQDQRRGPRLPGAMAALEEVVQLGGGPAGGPEAPRPVVGQLGQRRIEGLSGLLDQPGQRGVEVLVLALAEPIAAHVDGRAELLILVEGRRQLPALAGAEDLLGLGESLLVQLFGQGGPVEFGDAVGDGGAHVDKTLATLTM